MSVADDRASDKRILVAFGTVLLAEVVLAGLADAGTYPLWAWLILAIGAVLVAGLAFAVVQARTEGAPLLGARHRPPAD